MIDDKKIEEAARGAADLYEQDLPIMSYYEDTEVDGQHHFCQEFGAELFKDGARWAINEFLKDLWHSVDEMPNENNEVICVDKDNRTITYNGIANWWAFCRSHDVTRWLYVDDLLLKEGGEQ